MPCSDTLTDQRVRLAPQPEISGAFKRIRFGVCWFAVAQQNPKPKFQSGQGWHQGTSITIISPPPPRISMLLFVVWWPMWQWISHFPGCRAVQMTS